MSMRELATEGKLRGLGDELAVTLLFTDGDLSWAEVGALLGIPARQARDAHRRAGLRIREDMARRGWTPESWEEAIASVDPDRGAELLDVVAEMLNLLGPPGTEVRSFWGAKVAPMGRT